MNDACRHALADIVAAARTDGGAIHPDVCGSCRESATLLASIPAACRQHAEAHCDDVTRERALRAMADDLDDLARRRREANHERHGWRPVLFAGGMAVAAAAALLLWTSTRSPADSTSLSASPAQRMTPVVIEGDRALSGDATGSLGAALSLLRVDADTRVRLSLPGARLIATGPCAFAVHRWPDGSTDLWQRGGQLLVEVEPRPGRAPFTLTTPTTSVQVVGTVFATDDRGETTSVAVARGAVSVRERGRQGSVELAAGAQLRGSERSALDLGAVDALRAELAAWPDPPGAPELWRTVIAEPGQRLVVGGVELAQGPVAAAVAVDADVAIEPLSQAAGEPEPALESIPLSLPERDLVPRDRSQRPDSAETLYRRAETALANRDYERAEAAWLQLIARNSPDALARWARYDLARLAVRRGHTERARDHLRALLSDEPPQQLRELAERLLCRLDAAGGDPLCAPLGEQP